MTESEAREIVEKYEALVLAAQASVGRAYGFAQAHVAFTVRGMELWECDGASYGEQGTEVSARVLETKFLKLL